jgi:soluble lytic murein transglycosylase
MAARQHDRRGEHAAAERLLERLVRRSRGTDESAMYYLAQTYSDAGDVERSHLIMNQLRDLDRFSFYLRPEIPNGARLPVLSSSGSVALDGGAGLIEFLERARREKRSAYERIRAELAEEDAESEGEFAGCIGRGEWFVSVGLREWGERELEAARKNCFDSPLRMLELARLYDDYAMPWQSVRMFQRVMYRMPWSRRGEFSRDFEWLLYPTPYPVQVLTNAARYGVPPHLAYAMIREESRFDLEAVSRVGALGLMQIMPSTGRAIASELELPGWVEDDLLNPEINVAFGVWYAHSLLEAAGGDPLWMLAAYNAGPGNARRWFRGATKGAIDRVDGIDFKETRTYVQRIVESANIYHALYFAPDAMGGDPPR